MGMSACLHACMFAVCILGTYRCQKKASDHLEQKLQIAMSLDMGPDN